MPKILILSPLPEEAVRAMLGKRGEDEDIVIVIYNGSPGEELQQAVTGADIIIGDFTFRLPIDEGVAEAAKGCLLIQQPSVGYQHIDLEATRRMGIPVANAGAANAIGVAEHAIMVMLMLLKNAPYFHNKTARGEWGQQDMFIVGLGELHGKVLGIVGMGNIGREVAARARAFGCRIVYNDVAPLPEELEGELEAEWMELEKLLRDSDIVSLHMPLTPGTLHLIDGDKLALMKPNAYLLNLARGEVVDEEALAVALEDGRIAGAGVDVFSHEPLEKDCALLRAPNLVLSPHVAGATNESRIRIIRATAENLDRILNGREPLHVVNGVE